VERQAFLERLRARLSSGVQERIEREHAANERAEQSRGRQALAAATAVGPPEGRAAARRDCTALFVERLRELGVEVDVVASLDAARRALELLIVERGWACVACPPALRWQGIAERWTVEARDAPFGLCKADWAVAETGSVVVSSSAEVRRGYSLVPPAVGFFVPERSIVPTVGDVLRELPTHAQELPSCVSFVSGPSSTSDLAAVHVVGVHGPGEVFVWVIEQAGDYGGVSGS
jgi:L-lactate utilization protein LutC